MRTARGGLTASIDHCAHHPKSTDPLRTRAGRTSANEKISQTNPVGLRGPPPPLPTTPCDLPRGGGGGASEGVDFMGNFSLFRLVPCRPLRSCWCSASSESEPATPPKQHKPKKFGILCSTCGERFCFDPSEHTAPSGEHAQYTGGCTCGRLQPQDVIRTTIFIATYSVLWCPPTRVQLLT